MRDLPRDLPLDPHDCPGTPEYQSLVEERAQRAYYAQLSAMEELRMQVEGERNDRKVASVSIGLRRCARPPLIFARNTLNEKNQVVYPQGPKEQNIPYET